MRKTVVAALTLMVLLGATGSSLAVQPYKGQADPAQEVAAVPVDSKARGQAVFQLNADGTELSYRVTVSQLRDVTMSHLHLAPAGQNGPVVVWLGDHRTDPLPLVNGVYVTGTITDADLVGQLAGEPLSELVNQIEAGNIYFNAHTLTYPAGEIRGQLS